MGLSERFEVTEKVFFALDNTRRLPITLCFRAVFVLLHERFAPFFVEPPASRSAVEPPFLFTEVGKVRPTSIHAVELWGYPPEVGSMVVPRIAVNVIDHNEHSRTWVLNVR